MLKRFVLVTAGLAVAALCCSCGGEGGEGIAITKNLLRKDTNLRIYLDGQEAKQNTLKKGLSGYSPFTIKGDVTGTPKFKYEIIDVKKFGFIKTTMMQVHQKFQADFSDLADYKIFPTNDQTRFEPNKEYDLGALPPGFKILDKKDKEVSKVEFVPGVEYLLVFTVSADKSETVQIYFKTK